ncbi:MAG: acyltransferase family protein [Paludibacteraceae bacterium]|nr:acyltransferase family protein [Paludibacteraceae bacterium]
MRDRKADIAKFIGILLVVSCHANYPRLIEGRFFHMALFFFITGYLSVNSFGKPFKEFLISKVKTLYLPFLIAELIFIALHNVFYRMGIETYYFHWNDLWLSVKHAVLFNNAEMMLSPLWFLPALFFSNLLSYGLKRIGSDNQWLVASTVLAFLGVKNVLMQIPESRGFENGLNTILVAQWLCCIGYRLHQVDSAKWFESFSGKCMAARAVVWLYVFNRWGLLTVDMRTNTYDPVVFWLIATGVGIYLVFFLSHYFDKTGKFAVVLAYIGKNSLYIFILHILCFKLVCLAQVHWFGYSGENLPVWELSQKSPNGKSPISLPECCSLWV